VASDPRKALFLRESPLKPQMADESKRPLPALCPRMRLCLTDAPMPESTRVMGHGTLDQVRRDLASLMEMGARYVLLDTSISEDMSATTNHEAAWAMLATLADRVLDLPRETLR
jgi:hypothetical protein